MTTSPVRLGGLELAPMDRLELVDDPEFPGISIVGLGMVGAVARRHGRVSVELVPTFRGCTALRFIEADIRRAFEPSDDVRVTWSDEPWSTDRVRPSTRARLAEEYGVIIREPDGSLLCPVCGSTSAVRDTSDSGPTRCRSVAWCDDCRNVIEVLR